MSKLRFPNFPDYVIRDGLKPTAYQIFCGEDSEVIHERCAKVPKDREFPLYADDIEAARNLEPIRCFMCDGEIVAALQEPHKFQSMHGIDACWHCDSDYGQHDKPPAPTESRT